MRVRTRSPEHVVFGDSSYVEIWTDNSSGKQISSSTVNRPLHLEAIGAKSTIWDDVPVTLSRNARLLQRAAYAVRGFSVRNPEKVRPVRMCNQQKTSIVLAKDDTSLTFANTQFASRTGSLVEQGSPIGIVNSVSAVQPNWLDIDHIDDQFTVLGSNAGLDSGDWTALTERYRDHASAFLGNAFSLGEDLAEPDIFIDALKLVFQPSQAIRHLVHLGSSYFTKHSGKPLGHVVKTILKDASDANLVYNFGIAPAIADINAAIDSHIAVKQRMDYLIAKRGSFIPIHVRSVVRPTLDDPLIPAGAIRCFLVKGDYKVQLSMGSMARVRRDLNARDIWKAYVQYFGIDRLGSLAWNLLPFSFVVDWVTNFGSAWVNNLRLPIGGNPFCELQAFTKSYKADLLDQIILSGSYHPFRANWYMNAPYPIAKIGTVQRTVYCRSLNLPDTEESADLSGILGFHSVLGASLVFQRALK